MPDALLAAFPLVLAAVLIASGVSKLRSPEDLQGWADLGVPRGLRREWLLRFHPAAEIVLGVALAVLGGILGLLAALAAVGLMSAYTWLVVRAVSRDEDTSCACFGVRKKVTRVTVVRNAWLTAIAVAAAFSIWTAPTLGGVLVAGWPVVPALALAAVTTALVMWPDDAPQFARDSGPMADAAQSPRSESADESDELDYIRTRTPAVSVTLADGTATDLRALTELRPVLLLLVSPTCGWCEPIVAQRQAWRDLLPEVDVRLLLTDPPESSPWTETDEPQSLHDTGGRVAASLADFIPSPSAVLLGADGLLAGGPVVGDAIKSFIDDIYESLHGVRPPVPASGKA